MLPELRKSVCVKRQTSRLEVAVGHGSVRSEDDRQLGRTDVLRQSTDKQLEVAADLVVWHRRHRIAPSQNEKGIGETATYRRSYGTLSGWVVTSTLSQSLHVFTPTRNDRLLREVALYLDVKTRHFERIWLSFVARQKKQKYS